MLFKNNRKEASVGPFLKKTVSHKVLVFHLFQLLNTLALLYMFTFSLFNSTQVFHFYHNYFLHKNVLEYLMYYNLKNVAWSCTFYEIRY